MATVGRVVVGCSHKSHLCRSADPFAWWPERGCTRVRPSLHTVRGARRCQLSVLPVQASAFITEAAFLRTSSSEVGVVTDAAVTDR